MRGESSDIVQELDHDDFVYWEFRINPVKGLHGVPSMMSSQVFQDFPYRVDVAKLCPGVRREDLDYHDAHKPLSWMMTGARSGEVIEVRIQRPENGFDLAIYRDRILGISDGDGECAYSLAA